MSLSQKVNKSNRVRDFKLGSKEALSTRVHGYLKMAYSDTTDTEKLTKAAQLIAKFGGAEASITSAEVKLDIARQHAHQLGSKALLLIAEAGVVAASLKDCDTPHIALRAELLVNDIPLHNHLIENTLPSVSLIENKHKSRLLAIPRTFEMWKKVRKTNKNTDIFSTKGILGELSVRMLLDRYAIQHIGEGWVPLASTFSEDHGHLRGDGYREGWDISIYTDLREPVDLAHKLQVKSHLTTPNDEIETYTDDIDMIVVDDLRSSLKTQATLPQNILGELLRESEGETHMTRRLDSRTEALLDMFS